MIIQIAKPVLEQKKLYLITKRAFDIVCSSLGLLILAIPMLIIALLVTLDSPGSPIFKQERLGLHGKPFMIYKFRSMRLDAEVNGPQWADEQDPRCTHFGQILRRTRLDELPQFYNILRGDMSFVGPRPERAYFYGEFEKYIPGFSNRLIVVPGLTGYAQVNGGYSLANCKCKLDTCTIELSESERRSGWKPLAFILGDAAAAFGCVNRVEELVKQFLRGTVAQFLARPSV
ncbi:MAG: sugar transferase [Oscillospiraceae bacterium]